jgi:transcription factor TFIIIB component B''
VEDPQALEPLDWATTPMKAFCKDTERGIPMDKAAESTRARNRKRQRTNQTAEIKAEEVAPRGMASMGPQIRINAKGERVLDESSLIISHTQLTNEPEIDLDDIIEETADTQLTNYGSYARRIKPGRWNDESTHLFFKGLFLYGTDFEMVAQMLFPSLSRTNIKNKFKREEKKDPDRITRALLRRDEDLRLECLGNVVKAQVEEDELPSVELKQP